MSFSNPHPAHFWPLQASKHTSRHLERLSYGYSVGWEVSGHVWGALEAEMCSGVSFGVQTDYDAISPSGVQDHISTSRDPQTLPDTAMHMYMHSTGSLDVYWSVGMLVGGPKELGASYRSQLMTPHQTP